MKAMPTVVATPERDLGILLVDFQGAHPIENRDATGFYYHIQRVPHAPIGRLAVVFSGTVFYINTDAFGLPPIGDKVARFRVFAEAAIGDFLADKGLPDHTPSGVSAAQIECFSPHFQSWEDRRPASDDEIEAHLVSHVIWSWRFGQEGWELGLSDTLRLRQSPSVIQRLVSLGEGKNWTVERRPPHGLWLKPTPEFLRENRAVPTRPLCEELNICYRSQCYHAVAALTRTLLDHVPPTFGLRTFAEVANNYGGSKSFRECMQRLEGSARNIADMHLHTPIRHSEALPTRTQVNFSNDVDVLLAEAVRLLAEEAP